MASTVKGKRPAVRVVLYGIALFIIVAIVYLVTAFWFEKSAADAQRETVVSSQQNLVNAERSVISARINQLTADITFICDSVDTRALDSGDYSSVINEWIAFSDNQKIYDQIRFIDVSGNELIRVNYSTDGAYAVPTDELQNKANRYYFSESIGLEPNQIYISKLDLNIENDQIEQPIKPMMRLCIPYYDDTGTLRGIICLNYLAQRIISVVSDVAAPAAGKVSLLNSDGYWLYNEADESTEWAFMYPDRLDESFATSYPSEWEEISGSDNGSIITSNGLFTHSKVLTSEQYVAENTGYSLVLDEGDWNIVSYVPAEGEYTILFKRDFPTVLSYLLRENALVLALLFAVAMLLAALFERNRYKKAKIRYFSEYDEMTGILNRRAGLAQLEKAAQRRRGDDGRVSVCFIDVNGLKNVNDTFGHSAGDELILTVLEVIKENIRDRDSLIRMGGDEILIVFDGLDVEGAEKVWKRIVERYEAINESGRYRYTVSASHGIAELAAGKSLDEVIENADDKMYTEKREMKARMGTEQAK